MWNLKKSVIMGAAESEKLPLFLRQIWTNCEHAKNHLQKSLFQNILENTCKNGSAKPLFMRVPRGKCRNGGRPFQGIDTLNPHRVRILFPRRNGGRPFQGIDTLLHVNVPRVTKCGRNGGRPFQGIDTSRTLLFFLWWYHRRNGGRPFQGIDTSYDLRQRLRLCRRNGGRPFRGIDTKKRNYISVLFVIVEMKLAPLRA